MMIFVRSQWMGFTKFSLLPSDPPKSPAITAKFSHESETTSTQPGGRPRPPPPPTGTSQAPGGKSGPATYTVVSYKTTAAQPKSRESGGMLYEHSWKGFIQNYLLGEGERFRNSKHPSRRDRGVVWILYGAACLREVWSF